MLRKGDIVKTSYNTGPYEIITVHRNRTDPKYLDSINMINPPDSPEHICLTCKMARSEPKPSGSNRFSLNGYDEETLKSVWCDAYLIIIGHAAVQGELF